ncbi:hypothetical protein [Legionella sp.]|uniref:hypothetical protein n=1 Tax=Legionella sp. TaxID=459 RepID=UPI003220597C
MAMGELFEELSHTLPSLFWTMITGLARIGAISSYFIRDTFRAHFNLIAQYTAPIEQELLNKTPPKPKDLNPLGQIALTLFPLTIASWLAALTIAPLIYNSILLFIAGFVRVTNLALLDLPERKLNVPEGNMAWYRIIFGLPGLLIGGSLGGIAAGLISLVRLTINSLKSGKYSVIKITNLALDPEDYLTVDQTERSIIEKYGFGFPGLILGGIVASLGFTVAGLGRVAINSWFSFIGLNALAFNLVRQEKTIRELNDGRTPFRIYGLGLPGLILGSLTAPVAVAIAGVERIAIESWRTTKEFFFAAVNWALPTEQVEPSQDSIEEGKKEKRSKLNAYGFGAPGVLLGVLSGSIGFAGVVFARTLANSLASGAFSFIHVTNLALDPEDRIPQMQEEKSNIKRYGFGFPGIVLGGIAGGLGFTVAGLGRVAINSWSSFIGLNASAFNLIRQEKTNRELNDGRTPFRIYGLGLPGLILGSLTAPVAMVIASSERIARESWKTTKEIFIVIVNTVLPTKKSEEAAPERTEGNKRSKLDTYGFGAPGLLVGIISGGIGFVGALCARILINSFISALYMSILITNKALDPADRISQIEDDRSTLDVCGFGLPGLFLGALTGRLGFFAVGLGRVAINSFFTFVNVNSSAFNLVRQEQNARLKDERSPVLIYGLGLPGLILGGLTAPIAITIAGAERSARESWKTTKELFSAAVNLALPASKQEKTPAQSKDNRSKLNIYVFGAPGLLLGLISGGIGVIAIGFARTVTNSFKSGLNSFILVTNFALDSQHHLNPSQAKRSPIEKYGFGLPGLVLGGIAGGLGFTVAGLGRVTAHSFFTFIRINTAAFNRVRPSKSTEELKDERTPFLIYGLGLPGLILGSITAPIAIALASAECIAIESWQTTKEVFFIFVRLATPLEETEAQESHHSQAKSDNKNRSKLDTYIFGAPGILLGTLSGSIGFTFVALRQVVRHSIDTGIRTFTSISNVGLSDKEQFNYKPLEKEDNRGWQAKYLLGFPGAFIGAGLGILMLVGIGSVKGVSNTFYSWLSLSGSVLNGSLELPLFSGLAGDKRTRNQKIIGSLGYAVALVSTLPVGILILVSKKIIPVISALILGAICSPLVALLKGVNQSLQKPRFDEKELSEEDDKIQRFKNIYSALTPLGQLAESSKIPEQQNGRKGPLCFTRKAFTFNISTVTEYTLDQLLSAYRASTNKAAFFEPQGEFETVLEGVKEHYKEISCLDSEYHTAARDEQIDKIGNFARDYILNKETTVPSHLYSNPNNKWTAIFWGQESKNSEVSTNSQLQASMELS